MKAVGYKSWGGPHVLQVKEAPMPAVGDNEVMIEVAATGLNALDALCRRGALWSWIIHESYLGFECSGVVVTVGSKVSNFKEGDEVCAILSNGGGYAEFVSVPISLVVRIPCGISIFEAAALPIASCLSLYALSVLSEATPGKRILIHGAAGGVGVIALQYAKHVGCKVFAVAGTEEKLLLCKMLGADVCINYKKQDFRERVMAETGGKGVDIIVDINGSDYFQRNVDCLAICRSLVNLGVKGGHCADIKMSVLGAKDIRVVGGDLLDGNLERLKSLLSNVVVMLWPVIKAGYIRPIIGHVFSFSQVVEAHRAFEDYCFPGKLLLVPWEPKQNVE